MTLSKFWADQYWRVTWWSATYWSALDLSTGAYWAPDLWATSYWGDDYWYTVEQQAQLVAAPAVVQGSAVREVVGTGASAAQSATITSTELFEDIGSPAELEAGEATIAAAVFKGRPVVAVDIVAQAAIAAGTGTKSGRVLSATLQGQPATVVGVAARTYLPAPAALLAGSSTFTGSAVRGVKGTSALTAQVATTSATAARGASGQGTFQAQSANTLGSFGNVLPLPPPNVLGAGDLIGASATTAATTQLFRKAQGALAASAAGFSLQFTESTSESLIATVRASPARVQGVALAGKILRWDEADYPWGQPTVIHAREYPVMLKDDYFLQGDVTGSFDREDVEVVLERIGLTLLGRDRQGKWKVDPGVVKFITGIWPVMRGTPGTQVKLYVGGQDHTENPVEWEGPYICTIGETNFIDFTVSARYIALRFESTGQEPWELVSYDLELTTVGAR